MPARAVSAYRKTREKSTWFIVTEPVTQKSFQSNARAAYRFTKFRTPSWTISDHVDVDKEVRSFSVVFKEMRICQYGKQVHRTLKKAE